MEQAQYLETDEMINSESDHYLDRLNDAQKEAVEKVDGPVLVLAGAGTGKTRVLTTRLAHILISGRANPYQILAVTFTNKAAFEMKSRVESLIHAPVEGWWIGTFHSISTRILRQHAEKIGLNHNFTILDTDDQIRLIKQLMPLQDIDEKKCPPRYILGIIQRWKDRGLSPHQVGHNDLIGQHGSKILKIYHVYQERLTSLNAVDFGDLLLHCLTLFKNEAEVLRHFQQQFRYILVDEYQDTNIAQYLWLRALAMGKEEQNICCVGDEDQSIYGWRGAEIGNILKFEKDFPGAHVVRLEQNYRSTPQILQAASTLIKNNQNRLGKTLWTEGQTGEKILIRGCWDGQEEARFIGEEIETLQRKKQALSSIAILVRASFQTREFEERFITLGIPYRVIGGQRFYERQEIKDCIAYFRIVVQPQDDMALERIINLPKRGIGQATLQALHLLARENECSLVEAIHLFLQVEEGRPAVRKTLTALLNQFTNWRDRLRSEPHEEVAKVILEESGYLDMWQKSTAPEAPTRLENIKELIAALEEFASLQDFLEHVSLVMEVDQVDDEDKVVVMTLHAAKGLEFDTVFLPGWEEGLFPHQKSLQESGSIGLEEERRLAYVGLTRAMKRVIITFAHNRRMYNYWQNNVQSRFIAELSPDVTTFVAAGGFYQGNQQPFSSQKNQYTEFDQSGYKGPIIDGTVRHPGSKSRFNKKQISSSGHDPFSTGKSVYHPNFGDGVILSEDRDKAVVFFKKVGKKTIMKKFLEKSNIGNND